MSSNPAGATVDIDGQSQYVAPTTVKLERKRDHILVFSMEGHQQQQIIIMHVISGAVAGNILAGGLIGWGVDALTGAQYKLVPETVHVELKPLTAEMVKQKPELLELTPAQRLDQLKELRDGDQITADEYEAMRKIILSTLSGQSDVEETPAAADGQSE